MPKKPVFMDTMIAGAAVTAHRFVKATANDEECILATANAAIEGVSDDAAAYTTGDVDVPVIRLGIAELELGDTVTRGTHLWLKSDGTGRGVPIDSGSIQNVGAVPLQSGVVGDIIDVIVVTFASYPQANAADVLAPIADPGDAGAIPVDTSGYCPIVTTGAETRTIAAPEEIGQQLLVYLKTDGGDCVVTIATGVDQFGRTVITLEDAGDMFLLIAKETGASLRWSLVASDGDEEIADPGDAGAIPVTQSGFCDLVTDGGAQTRTLAAPSFKGQTLLLSFKTDGGTCTITCATTVNQTGNNTIALDDAGDAILLIAKTNGANKRWSVVSNDGCTLSTV